MSVMIGQASIDENGKIVGGQAGNQSGRELNKSPWYKNGWTLVIRAKDPKIAEKMAQACEKGVANRKIGYDQSQRNTLRAQAKLANWDLSKLAQACETDCSAFVAVCAECAGVNMEVAYTAGNAPATFQMRRQWAKTNAFDMLTDGKYLNAETYLRRGDVLVNESRHACMVLSDGPKADTKNSEIVVNGKSYPINRQLIGGSNYFKIRDLVDVLREAGVCNLEVSNKGNIAVLKSK